MQWNRLVVNLWSKMSLFCSMKEGVSYLFLSATTYLLFCHVQPPPRSAVPHVCCRPSNGRKMQALTAVEWLTAVRYETDGRLANGWTDGLPENRLTGLGAGLPLTLSLNNTRPTILRDNIIRFFSSSKKWSFFFKLGVRTSFCECYYSKFKKRESPKAFLA